MKQPDTHLNMEAGTTGQSTYKDILTIGVPSFLETLFTTFASIIDSKKTISRAVDYFIHCYDKVSALIEGKDPHVEKIEVSELVSYSKKIRDANRRNSG